MSVKQLVFWFVFVLVISLLWQALSLPDEATIKTWLGELIATYGVWFVLMGSFLEALLLIGFYFPGSLLIFLSVSNAPDSLAAFVMVLAVSIGVFVGYSTDYMLGRHGWYRLLVKVGFSHQIEKAKANITNNDFLYILSTYWNPALASITATAAGIVGLSRTRFIALSVFGIIFWNSFWGILVYNLGPLALSLISTKTVLSVLALCIIVTIMYRMYQKRYVM